MNPRYDKEHEPVHRPVEEGAHRPSATGVDRSSFAPVTDLSVLDAGAQAELVRTGDASAAELVEGAITRVEKLNGELNAVIHPLYDRARDAVRRGLPAGPFTGVPIVVKDLDGTLAGAPYHAGNKA